MKGDAAQQACGAIKLRPQFVPSYYMLSFVIQASRGDLKEGLSAIQTALRLAPQNRYYLLTLAQYQMNLNDYAAAQKTLAPLLSGDDDPGLKTSAQSMRRYIEYQTTPRSEPTMKQGQSEPSAGNVQKVPHPTRRASVRPSATRPSASKARRLCAAC